MFKKQAGSRSGTGSKSKINAEAGSESEFESEENNFGSMTLPETVVQENF
jgi:hypothetical protein